MNGEMHQICMLVSEVRNAMAGKNEFEYMADGYINSILFSFIPQKTFFGEESRKAYSPREWYAECIRKGVSDMKFLAPLQVPDRSLLGFSNVSRSCMVSFHKNGMVTSWMAVWEYDKTLKKWNVGYQEYQWENPPAEKPRFKNNTVEFADILLRTGLDAAVLGKYSAMRGRFWMAGKRFPIGMATECRFCCLISRKRKGDCFTLLPWRMCSAPWVPGMTIRLAVHT